ncbi:MAG TPA: hemolysin family protein [Roseiflexaceae bacterium]|nr:hemolysin family protein [Roseiflexaceae bacterium]HMP40026.1 hemolysin family protein [Roseiflexaceae bacterium]
MLENNLTEILIILILILANGFFAASEIAVVSSRKGRLEQQVASGRAGAQAALRLADNPSRFLSTVQVGITVFGTFAAVFGGAGLAAQIGGVLATVPILAPYAAGLGATVVALSISYLSLIIGELVPKRIALQNAESIASFVAPFMEGVARIAAPVVSFLTFSTEVVLRLLGRRNLADAPVTEDDIMALVREGAAEGTVAAAEQDLITNVFTLSDRTVRSIMTPRTQIVAVEINTPLVDALRLITDSGYSRLPVYQESLDHVVGMLYVKDMLHALADPAAVELRTLVRPPIYVLESQRAAAAFQQLKQRRSALAIVLDEYGQVAGVVSVEDILEELVGDIEDEYDDADESFVRREDGSYLVDGLLPFVDFQQRLPLPEVEELVREHGFETLAGFMLAILGHIPSVGAVIRWHGYTFEVVDMDGRRIDRILIIPPPVEVVPGDAVP